MRQWKRWAVAIVAVWAGAAEGRAGFTMYTSQAAFEAAAGGLVHQDFSAARVAAGNSALSDGTLSSTTNNDVFHPGDIAPGVSIFSTNSSPEGNMLYVSGVGTTGNDVRAVYTNGSNATYNVAFAPQVNAVGMTLLSFTGTPAGRFYFIDVLGSFSTTPQQFSTGTLPTTGTGNFIGFIGTGGEQIQRISFEPSISSNIGLTSLEFDGPAAPPTAATPAPPTAFGALAAVAIGAIVRRRRGSRA